MQPAGFVKARHDRLAERYREAFGDAWVCDGARTVYGPGNDPFHGVVRVSEHHVGEMPFGIHPALGGDHDLPNPGDILCAALAACLDATLRMIADRLGIPIAFLEVSVTGELDARGPLKIEPTVPAGFQAMTCRVTLEATSPRHSWRCSWPRPNSAVSRSTPCATASASARMSSDAHALSRMAERSPLQGFCSVNFQGAHRCHSSTFT